MQRKAGCDPTEGDVDEGAVLHRVPEWAFPHTDAESYITDVISRLGPETEPDEERDFSEFLDILESEVESEAVANREEATRAFAGLVREAAANLGYRTDDDILRLVAKVEDDQGEEISEIIAGLTQDAEDGVEDGHYGSEERGRPRSSPRQEKYDRHEGISREDYDVPEDIHLEAAAEGKDRILAARDALSRGDAEDLLSALTPLLDREQEDLDDDTLLNWSLLLADPAREAGASNQEVSTRHQVIIAVHDLADRLCRIVASDRTALREVEWRNLEYVVAHALDGLGFDVTLTPPSKDGGRDVVAMCSLLGRTLTYFVEIKHWRSGKRVGSREVFDFLEVNLTEQTDGALFISTSGFAVPVFSHLVEIGREHIRLGNDTKVVTLCQQFVRRGLGLWTSPQTLPEILFEDTLQ